MTLALGAAALAADLPKEGTFSGTFSGVGTYKAYQVGKERLLLVFDENELQLTNGLLDLLFPLDPSVSVINLRLSDQNGPGGK
jgi:hypothetical protein